MGKAFSIQGDVQLDTQGVKADLAGLEKTQTKVPIAMDAREAKLQAESMLSLVDRMDRKVARPKVDTTSIRQAKDAVSSLDKAWDQVASNKKAKLQQLSGAFSAGQSLSYGGIGGAMSAMPALAGAGGTALLAAGGGAAVGALAGAGIGSALVGSVNRAIQEQKLESFMGRAYKGEAAGFVTAADDMAAATGFLADDFLRASLIGKTLVANYGLQTDQIKRLVEVSADLAATSPYEDIQTVSNAMERVQSAIRGEAEASERLGLTLNDTYMKNIAFDGSLKGTWEKLSDLEKAQYRYQEILNQTKDVLGAAEDDEGLSTQVRQLKQVLSELGTELAEPVLPLLAGLVQIVKELGEAIPDWVPKAVGWTAKYVAPVLGEAIWNSAPGVGTYHSLQKVGRTISDVATGPPPLGARWLPDSVRDKLGSFGGQWLPEGVQTKIVLINQSNQPLRVQDAQSYAPSNY